MKYIKLIVLGCIVTFGVSLFLFSINKESDHQTMVEEESTASDVADSDAKNPKPDALTSNADSGNASGSSGSTQSTDPKRGLGISYLTGPKNGDPLDIALAYIDEQKSANKLTEEDIKNSIITDHYASRHNGVTHVYLCQQQGGIDVINARMNINIAEDGSVINMGSSFVSDLASNINTTEPKLTPFEAVEYAAQHLGLDLLEPLNELESKGGVTRETVLSDGGISKEDVSVKLVYYAMPGDSVHLAWKLELPLKDHVDDWIMGVDALNGDVIYEFNRCHSLSYNVYALPMTDPLDGAQSRSVQVDPHTQSPSQASPYGWHDTDGSAGAEYTITRGNNAHVYEDSGNLDDSVGNEPDGGASLTFDAPIDLGQEPNTYTDASVINMFYWCNLLHDIHYDGFSFEKPGVRPMIEA